MVLKTFLLTVEYNGTNYNGFQRQEQGTAAVRRSRAHVPAPTTSSERGGPASCTSSTGSTSRKRSRTAAASSSLRLVSEHDASSTTTATATSTTTSTSTTSSSISKSNENGRGRHGRPITTIQDRLESALARLTNRTVAELRVRGAGRTDKGVHARGQVVAFDYSCVCDGDDDDDDDDDGQDKDEEGDDKNINNNNNNKHRAGDASIFRDASPSSGELWRIRRAINSRLPSDIAVRSVRVLPSPPPGGRPFEARRDVRTKRYTYRMRFRKKRTGADGSVLPICWSGPNTLRRARDGGTTDGDVWVCPWALEEGLMQRACDMLRGKHDFSSFVVKSDRTKRDNNIYLKKFKVVLRDDSIDEDDESCSDADDNEENCGEEILSEAIPCNAVFILEAGGFRRQMVRRLVGFVVDVARGNCSLDDIPRVLEGTDEVAQVVNAAPACGLCLSKVEYNTTGH